jgi:hypothetical protein
MLLQGSNDKPFGFARTEDRASGYTLPRGVLLNCGEDRNHLFGKLVAMAHGVQMKQASVDSKHIDHISLRPARKPARRVSCFMRLTSACRLRRPCEVRR